MNMGRRGLHTAMCESTALSLDGMHHAPQFTVAQGRALLRVLEHLIVNGGSGERFFFFVSAVRGAADRGSTS